LRQARELGAFYETLLYQHLPPKAELLTHPDRLYYWRDAPRWVDSVIEHGRLVLAIRRRKMDAAAGI
jgi:predicted AAA+ superfamily ATPase